VPATLDDYHWLTSDAALAWLALARERLPAGGFPPLALVAELRKAMSPERAHLVLEQVELRERAKEKFARAEQMFFTRKGLEQATDEQIAAYKANRFPSPRPVADLCCGIGGDLLALAARGEAIGIDFDPAVAHLAMANCPQAEIRVANVAEFPLAETSAWHIDPDRRPAGKRTSRIELHEPSLHTLAAMLEANSHAAIKLAPAGDVPEAWSERSEREWIGSRGQCRQQVVWFGSLARHAGEHAATIVDARGGVRTIHGEHDVEIPIATAPARFIYEPHAAVLAAHLQGAVANEHGLSTLASRIAYFTGDALIEESALDAFEVLEVLPLDRKRLKSLLRERRIGRLEVKKRGVDLEPDELRKAVVSDGDEPATLLVYTSSHGVLAILAKRVGSTSQ
jgi:hypothetical protein